jgi:hypothetical protein
MRLSGPLSLLAAVGVLVGVLGSALTLARDTLGLGGSPPDFVAAAMATTILVAVAVLVAVLTGLRGGQNASTPYW